MRRIAFPVILLALATAAAWSQLLHAPFLYDDHLVVERDAAIVAAETSERPPLRSIWLEPRPLRALTHRLDARLFGPANAGAPHAVNLCLHWLCAALWMALLVRLGRPRREALAAALLFAVLPVGGESLGIVSHRKEMLALAPMLAALWLVTPPQAAVHQPPSSKSRLLRLLGAMALFAMAVMGKETALALPALAAICAWESKRGAKNRPGAGFGALGPALSLAVAAIALAALSWLQVRASMAAVPGGTAQSEFPRPGHLPAGTTLPQAAAFALWALPRYALRLVSFTGLGIDPATPLPSTPSAAAVFGGAAFALAWATAVFMAIRRRAAIAFPLAWAAIAIAPAIFPPLLRNGGLAILADRYAYAAAPGAALLIAAAIGRMLPRHGAAFPATVAALAIAYGAAARSAAADYSSEQSLWQGVLARNPDSYLAHYNLAFSAWRNEKRPDAARHHFQRMLALRPDFTQGLQGWVNFLSQADGSRAAIAWLDGQLSAGASEAPASLLHKHRGALRSAGGDLRGAEEDFRACLAAGLDDSAIRHNLAVVLQRQLRWKEAAVQFNHSKSDVRLPDDVALAAALGGTWARRHAPTNAPAIAIICGDSVPAGYDAAAPGKSRSIAERLNYAIRTGAGNGSVVPPGLAFRNRAVPGSLLHELPEKLPALLDPPEVTQCAIMAGHNDAFAGTTPAVLMRDMADCILICRLRGVEPIVLGPIPVRSTRDRDRRRQESILAEWNRRLAKFCAENRVAFLDVRSLLRASAATPSAVIDTSTGNHLNENGMGILTEAVMGLPALANEQKSSSPESD